MKKIPLALPCSLLLLSACSGTAADDGLAERLNNPLYAERYYDAMTDHMVSLVISEDPLAADENTKEVIEEKRLESLRLGKEASSQQLEGQKGFIISDYSASYGEALLLDDTLYVSSDFEMLPGPSLRVYLSTLVDPRDGTTFPDETAVDLGPLKSAFGAHSYAVPDRGEDARMIQSLVFYDEAFKRIYAFAQLQVQN